MSTRRAGTQEFRLRYREGYSRSGARANQFTTLKVARDLQLGTLHPPTFLGNSQVEGRGR